MTVIDRRYSVAEGTAFKAPCRVATTANVTLGGLQSIDGVTVAEHDRVLVKDQTDETANGIYEASTGNWSRAKDFDGAYDIIQGTKVYVTSGGEANTEYTVTSADPMTIGTSNITFEVAFDSILEDAEAAATLATAAAAALGNQAYTFDYYTQAESATVPVGVKNIRLMGYYAAGDAPVASYYRVVSQPSTTNRIRTTDRFLPNGSTSAGNGGWWQMVLDDLTDVRKYGVLGDGSTDGTTKLNGAITAGSVVIPASASNYILSGDITFVSNRRLVVENGATVINTGGRFTAYLPGGGNVHIRNDGVMGFLATATGAVVGDWRSNVLYPERGCIEMGGTQASPAGHFSVTGTGRVYSDYSFTNLASTGITDLASQINHKGIAFFNCHDVLVEGLEVDHMYGEAVYHLSLSSASSYNVIFTKNNVHHCAFNALNFNSLVAFEHFEISHNRVENCFTGVELSTGFAINNRISAVQNGIATGGGGGLFGLRIIDNHVYSTTGIGIDVEFDPAGSSVEGIIVRGNTVEFAGTHAYFLSKITGFQLKDNFSYAHATVGAGLSYSVASTAVSGHIDGNCTKSPGAFSTGTLVNAGSGSTVGTNPNI